MYKNIVLLDNYSPAADIVCAAVCLVMFVLIGLSYISKTKSTKYFLSMVGLVFVSALTDMTFYSFATVPELGTIANWIRCAYHIMLFLIFVHYIAYICEITRFEKTKTYVFFGNIVFALASLAEIVTTATGRSFYLVENGVRFNRHGIFFAAYLLFMLVCLLLMIRVKNLLFSRIMAGFYGTIAISVIVLIIQGIFGQSSYTVAALMLPVIAMMYTMHSNPYDALLGTNDAKAMHDFVAYCYNRNKEFVFMSLYLRAFEEEGREMPDEIKKLVRQFTYKYFRSARVFRVSKGHMIVMFLKKQDKDYELKVKAMVDAFYPLYDQFRYDYKIVLGGSIDEISKKNDYVGYIKSIHRKMPECSVHKVGNEDVSFFRRSEYITSQLADIYRVRDLDDKRVLVYCQPVLNVTTGKYDTAEALMRLYLDDLGLVYPDEFIPLAEEQDYIHILTEIILHKTCMAIKSFTEQGYDIKRISVNVSAQELKDKTFCTDILEVINGSGIKAEKIAIELTESRNENDFILMKEKLLELKEKGIKFYLDDFGTGYSNMERIMELPFDIIKFDRSLVLASESSDRSKQMVENLANMFSKLNYCILYEGIEKTADEKLCLEMSASYLQGFKYSKPTPIEKLSDYISRQSNIQNYG